MNKMIKTAMACGLSLMLCGCIHAPEVTLDNAAEVAMDDAGYEAGQIKDLSTEDNGKEFVISFVAPNGTFNYTIGYDGIITGRHFDNTGSTPTKAEEPKEEKQESTKQKEDEKPASSTTHASDNDAATTRNPSQQHALNLALNNAGLAEDDVTNIVVTISADGSEAEVRFNYGQYQNIVTVDLANSVVTNAFVQ